MSLDIFFVQLYLYKYHHNAVGINGRGYRFGCTSNAIGGPYLNIKWENNLLFAQQGEL